MNSPVFADRPATFREVMANSEYRAVITSSTLSWFGDNAARAAVAALAFQQTQSVMLSAAAFAISYLPWIGIGSVLTAVAERYSYKKVMIICDILRMITMALIAIPGLNIPAILILLFFTSLLSPPFDAARSALIPQILKGDSYIVGLSLSRTMSQTMMVVGYIAGGWSAWHNASTIILFNAVTFAFSATILFLGVLPRPPALSRKYRSGIIRETRDGFLIVFRSPLLRSIAILMFLTVFFSILPEGLAAGWAAHLTKVKSTRGIYQGLIMMSSPMGFVIGVLAIGRFTVPSIRIKLIKPFAVLSPLILVPAFFDLKIYGVVIINAIIGFLVAGLLPATNGLFVQALPDAFRARAFGVMQSGLMISQGLSVLVGGVLSDQFPVPTVIAACGVVGTIIMLFIVKIWPSNQIIYECIKDAIVANGESSQEDPHNQENNSQETDTPVQSSATTPSFKNRIIDVPEINKSYHREHQQHTNHQATPSGH